MSARDVLAGRNCWYPAKDGIAARFETFLKTNHSQPGAELLKGTYQYMLLEHAADPDTLVHEWAEGVIGDQYPVPDRILQFTEMIVQDYLAQEMCDSRPPKGNMICSPPKAVRQPCATFSTLCRKLPAQ